MADLEKIVKMIFEGDGKGLSTELNKMDKDFTSFTNKIKDSTGSLGDFGMGVAKAEAALVAMGAAGLIYAYEKAKEFENGVISLDKVMDEDEGLAGGLEIAKKAAIEFGDKYGESSKNVIYSIADFKEANYTLTESIQLSEDAMRLKIAGDLDAAEASEYLKRILAGFKAEASDSARVIDSLNGVSNVYNTNVRELAIGMGDLSGVAEVVGMTFEETEGLLTPIISVFGSGSEAANALKTGLIRLVDNTAPVVAAMESIGVSQRGANGELKSAYDILGEVAKAFEKTDQSQRLFIAGEIFGKEQTAKMVQILTDWDQVLAVTEVALNSTGSALEEVNKRLLSPEVAVNRAIVGWENLNIAIGQKFVTGATGAVNACTDIENALRKSLGQESFDVIWVAINEFFDDTTQLLKTVAKNLPETLGGVDFSKLVQSFKDLGGEIGEALDALFGGELDLTTVEGLEDAIQKIIDIATEMTKFTEGFVDGLKPMLRIIGEITDGVTGMDDATVKSFGNMSGTAKIITEITGKLQLFEKAIYAIAVTSTVSAIPALVAYGISIAAVTLALASAGASAYILAKGLNAIGLVDDKTILQIESSIRSVGDTIGLTSEKLKAKPLKPILFPISPQETESAFWDVNEGIKKIEENPIKITIDKTQLDELLSDEIFVDGKKVSIWTEFDDMAYDKVQAQKEALSGPIQTTVTIDGQSYLKFEDGVSDIAKPIDKPVELKPTILEQAKLDLERELNAVDNQAKTVQTAMEWKAKIDIADIEGSSKVATEAFSTIGASVVETSGDTAQMFSDLASGMNNMRTSDKWFMMDRLQEAQDKNSELIDSQIKLTEQQVEYMRLRNEKIENGETAEIKIDTTGVEPAIEMVMWNIIEKVQIRANENAQEFLLGLPSI